MSSPIRLKASLLRDAEAEARIFSRSVPKQIEFWAEIGRNISHSISNDELVALLSGVAKVKIETVQFDAIDSEQIFELVDRKSKDGSLANAISKKGKLYYEASKSHPGQLDQISEDGSRTSGYFRDGKFKQSKQR